MSEREPGLGSFVVGIAVGVTLGLMFATEDGPTFRGKLARRLRALRALGTEKAGDLGALIIDATLSEGQEPRRLTGGRRGRRRPEPGEEDESAG
jgi:hypothetical protein